MEGARKMADVVSKSYRFPQTRHLRASYTAVIPEVAREGDKARELREALIRREEANVTGEERDYPIHLPTVSSPLDIECDEDSHLSWSARLQGPLFHKIAALRRALYLAGKDGKEVEEGVCALLESARESPSTAAKILSNHISKRYKIEEGVRSDLVQCAGEKCGKRALPFSRYCLLHISSDPDQVLYGSCTATDSAHLPCNDTVYDFMLNQSLCTKHVTKAALECPVQQKKKSVPSNKITKSKSKGQKVKKTKTTPSVKVTPSQSTLPKSPSSSSTLPLPTLSSSSWSSGDSEEEDPVTSVAKRKKVMQQPPKKEHRLPSLTPEVLSLPLPLPSLILPPPLPDIGKFMDDSSSEEDT